MARLVDGLVSIDLRSNTVNGQEIFTLVFQGEPHANVSVSFYEMSKSGPHLILGIPQIPLDNNGGYRFQLTRRWDDGLYIAHIVPALNPPTIPQLVDPLSVDPINTKAFQLGTTEGSLEEAVRLAVIAQNAFRNREIRAGGFTGDNRFIVHVIVDRCYLDYRQIFEGGMLRPMNYRLGPQSILAAVDSLFPSGITSAGNQTLGENYAYNHPLCLVSFVNVQATDHNEAVRAIQMRLDRVLSALAENRSASPEPLAYLSENAREGLMLTIVSNIYQGNLIPGFGPGVTGLLDLIETGAQSDPWIDFALRLMRSVRTQTNQEAQLFLAWSLIEAAAKRNIPLSKIIVLDDDGKPIMTSRGKLDQSRDLGRVIVYLRDHVGQNMLVNLARRELSMSRCA